MFKIYVHRGHEPRGATIKVVAKSQPRAAELINAELIRIGNKKEKLFISEIYVVPDSGMVISTTAG